ncbi:hypothetical protein HaLaN_03312 [Haematococcus lacustris]|uniref:Uncharacterized protein n=1 Tax=Haematococcus lacustris TaxID=44745 RepID=A0A699YGL5_HAELA|nr:hypothetical protein HaLaN_03312 [Haematococcus lacustris]
MPVQGYNCGQIASALVCPVLTLEVALRHGGGQAVGQAHRGGALQQQPGHIMKKASSVYPARQVY